MHGPKAEIQIIQRVGACVVNRKEWGLGGPLGVQRALMGRLSPMANTVSFRNIHRVRCNCHWHVEALFLGNRETQLLLSWLQGKNTALLSSDLQNLPSVSSLQSQDRFTTKTMVLGLAPNLARAEVQPEASRGGQ